MERLILENVRVAIDEAIQQVLCLKDATNYHRSGPESVGVMECNRLQRDIDRLEIVVLELEQNISPKEVFHEQEGTTDSFYPANTERFDF